MNKTTLLDKLTFSLSSLCIVHCLSLPLVIVFLPAIGTFFTETIELIFIISIIPISISGFLPVWLRHRTSKRLVEFLAGLSLLIISQFALHQRVDFHTFLIESSLLTMISIIGTVLMAYAIYKNRRHTHVCRNPAHDHSHSYD